MDHGLSPSRVDRADAVALGSGATVTMWALAYLCRLPAVMAPGWLLLVLLGVAVVAWGALAGRLSARGWRAALEVGAFAGFVNLLILGSVLSAPDSGGFAPSALWWVAGSIGVMAAVSAAAGAVAARVGKPGAKPPDWKALLSKVAAGATFLLVVAGGLVTSNEAGLAVPDWPNSEGFNMFLFPLARMTGGIYYEHAHRLFGALVGLTTVILAMHLWRREERRWVRRLSALAVAMVVVQGVLGGLRVTGRFTLSASPHDLSPVLGLAVVHGVLGQVFLATMVVLAVVTSRRWSEVSAGAGGRSPGACDALHVTLIISLFAQLVLGAAQRHLANGLLVHITAAAVVTVLAVFAGARAWFGHGSRPPLGHLGRALAILVGLQVVLGVAALAATRGEAVVGDPSTVEVTLATAHQAGGALLLACAVALTVWHQRLRPAAS